MSVSVVQLGARMHYAVPRILSEAGHLGHLYTDACSFHRLARALSLAPMTIYPGAVRRFLGRTPNGIPRSQVHSFIGISLKGLWRSRKAEAFSVEQAEMFLDQGRQLCRQAINGGVLESKAIYMFNSASLPLLEAAKRAGVKTIYEQTIAPVKSEWTLIKEEHLRWTDWEISSSYDEFYGRFSDVEAREHELADQIICGSEFVKQNIVRRGGQPVDVVPYGVSAPPATTAKREFGSLGRKLRVLTVGAVGLRKGAPYVHEAATRLRNGAEFRWVGKSGLTEQANRQMASSVTMTGVVPRSEMINHYAWADVFLLPSICEGSATVTYEAIQYGLPLVITPNTGAPVPEDTGVYIPIRDSDAIVSRIQQLADDPVELERLRAVSWSLAPSLTFEAYRDRLLKATLPTLSSR